MKLPCRLISVLLGLWIVGPCSAQPASGPLPLKVWIAGGLLGRMRGFCEIPQHESQPASPSATTQPQTSCPAHREPYGGAMALSDEMSKAAAAGAYALLAGNNFPKNFTVPAAGDQFWQEVANAKPQVVAVGQDDLLRAMLPADVPGVPSQKDSFEAKTKFLAGWGDLHFLATNVVVRKRQKDINTVLSNGFRLQFDPDKTVSWLTKKVAIQLPVGLKNAGPMVVTINGKAEDQTPKDLSINLTMALKPGVDYKIDLAVKSDNPQPAPLAHLSFRTDDPLTPWENQGAPDGLQGIPVAMLSGRGPAAMVVALIDPEVTGLLNSRLWSSQQKIPAEDLVVLAPDEVAQEVLTRAGTTPAIPILISDMSDTLNLRVLRMSDRWRIVSLNPDSSMLGCQFGESGCGQDRKQPYSYGNTAVLDGGGDRPQVWVRPEWLAEKLTRIEAKVQGTAWSDTQAQFAWIPGFTRAQGEPTVTTAPSRQTFVSASGAVRVLDMPAQIAAGPAEIWWQQREDVAVVLMEAMRRATHAEIAVVDKKMIDQDVLEELAEAGSAAGISYYQLMDIFWRHDSYVRVFEKGTDLPGLLTKVAQLPIDDDGGYCVRGLRTGSQDMGCGMSAKADAATLRVNGRYLDPNMMYTVAMPQALAQRLGLTDQGGPPADVLIGIFEFLKDGNLPSIMPPKAPSKTTRPAAGTPGQHFLPEDGQAAKPGAPAKKAAGDWANPSERRWLGMIYFSGASLSIGGQNYSVPSQGNGTPDTSGFAAIPNVGEKVTHNFRFNLAGEFHLVPIDIPWFTVDLSSRSDLNRLDTYPNVPNGLLQIAYSPDSWTNGAELRSRWLSDTVTSFLAKIRGPHLRVEPFVGYYDDTSIFHFKTQYQITKNPSYVFQEDDPKPSYAYLAGGFELGDVKIGKYFTLKSTAYEHDSGVNYTAPKGVTIGGSRYTMDLVRRCGIQKLIDGGTGCPAAVLNGQQAIFYSYAVQREGRNSLATSLEFAYGGGAAKKTLTLVLKGNLWDKRDSGFTPLDPLWTGEMTLKSGFPVFKGISIGPYLRYYFVKAYQAPGTFMSNQYGFALSVPLVTKGGNARFIY